MNRITSVSSLCFTLLISSATISFCDEIHLNFKDSVMVNDTVITLADIATVGDCNLGSISKLNEFMVGNAAPAGYSRFVNRDDLITYVLQPSFKSLKFTASGANRTRVFTDYVEKKILDGKKDLLVFLNNELQWPKESWELRILNEEETFKIINKPYTVQFSELVNKKPRGGFNVTMNIVQGSKCTHLALNCQLKVVLNVVVAAAAIERGQVIQNTSCVVNKLDVTHLGIMPYSIVSEVVGKKAQRFIAEGQIISKLWVLRIPEIEKGDPVTIIAIKSNIRVSVGGVAREPGIVGEKIWVENLESHKLVRVVVKSKGVVFNL